MSKTFRDVRRAVTLPADRKGRRLNAAQRREIERLNFYTDPARPRTTTGKV